MSISNKFSPLMAATSKSRTAKQGINYVSKASGATSQTGGSIPSATTDALTGLQATLEKSMHEMAQVCSILKGLQEDVSSVKAAQAKTSQDITVI